MSENSPSSAPNETTGILYATAAYSLWGFFPLYWHALGSVPPFQISMHRMFWCALFGIAICAATRRFGGIRLALSNRKILAALTVSSILISINWTLYIFAVADHHLVEASLGYYINPLISIALGVVLLGEKLSRLRMAAIALATIAVVVKAYGLGHFPWIALGLAFSFGFYGYVRKLTPIAAFDGLTIEVIILFPLTAGALLFWGVQGTSAFTPAHPFTDFLLVMAGPVTALPLTLFAAGARRVSMSTLGFLQYLSPSITLTLAVVFLGEAFTPTDMATFGCIWLALILVAVDGQMRRKTA
ncbi:MAG: EamA family transporter RarD [Rhizomicrobium sp.]|nr:EamA family transporter RarD [Rhizomicrobium sp.]